jgi:hypothetical protein
LLLHLNRKSKFKVASISSNAADKHERVIILSRVLVTETGFGLVIGFINRFTLRNYDYSQLFITFPVIQLTVFFY